MRMKAEAETKRAEAEAAMYLRAALGAKNTSERWLVDGFNILARAYDEAKVVDFWLPFVSAQMWTGVDWEKFAVQNRANTESAVIQDKMTLSKLHSKSPYELVDTHNGWNKLTQDGTLFLKNAPHSELTAAVLVEWVGQDSVPFPDHSHKSKLLRDGLRLYKNCGGQRQVHMVISDLCRAVAVRILGVQNDGIPIVEKTSTEQKVCSSSRKWKRHVL